MQFDLEKPSDEFLEDAQTQDFAQFVGAQASKVGLTESLDTKILDKISRLPDMVEEGEKALSDKILCFGS